MDRLHAKTNTFSQPWSCSSPDAGARHSPFQLQKSDVRLIDASEKARAARSLHEIGGPQLARMILKAALACFVTAIPAADCLAHGPGGTATASDYGSAFQEYAAAAQAILRDVGQPGEKSSLPDANAPNFRRFVKAAQSISPALARPGLGLGPESFDRICGPANEVLVSYQLAGLNQAGEGAARKLDAERTQALVRKNLAIYLDQLFPLVLFSSHCQAVYLDAVRSFANALPEEKWTPARLAGARQIRDGIYQTLLGMFVMAADPSLPAATRSSMLSALAADAGSFAPAVSLEGRRKLLDKLRALPAPAGPDRASVETIARRLEAQGCDKLCSI